MKIFDCHISPHIERYSYLASDFIFDCVNNPALIRFEFWMTDAGDMTAIHFKCEANTIDAAKSAVQLCYDRFTTGILSFVRVEPEASSHTDFKTKAIVHQGYTRFSVSGEPGERKFAEKYPEVSYLGFATELQQPMRISDVQSGNS